MTSGARDDLVERLKQRIRRHVLAELLARPRQSSQVEALGLRSLLTVYGNWRFRQPPARRRQVHISQELAEEIEQGEAPEDLPALIQKIEEGLDLKPFLSRQIEVAFEPETQKPHHQRSDLDLLLAEWGVHHLHLSTVIQSDGFAKRTRDLLFVVFRPTDAYLIGVFPHGSWTRRSIAERAVRNWPDAEIFLRSNYAIGLSQQWDESAAPELREAGINQLLEIDGRVYSPLGQTLGGTPMVVSRRVMHLLWQLDEWKSHGDEWLNQAAEGTFVYWLPAIHNQQCGFQGNGRFVSVADLP